MMNLIVVRMVKLNGVDAGIRMTVGITMIMIVVDVYFGRNWHHFLIDLGNQRCWHEFFLVNWLIVSFWFCNISVICFQGNRLSIFFLF